MRIREEIVDGPPARLPSPDLASDTSSSDEEAGDGMLCDDLQLPDDERFFEEFRGPLGKTSKNTLENTGLYTMESLPQAMAALKPKMAAEINRLQQNHSVAFHQWMFELSNGFSLLLYGYGSKRRLAVDFVKACCKQNDGAVSIVVNGYNPLFSIRHLLAQICSEILGRVRVKGPLETQVAEIVRHFTGRSKRPYTKLYLLIQSIDASPLRQSKTQEILAILSSAEHIHLVATMDHINAPLLWDAPKTIRYNFIWHDATTFQPYRDELADENFILDVGQRRKLTLTSLRHVLSSLPDNSKRLFYLVAEMQVDQNNSRNGTDLGRGDIKLEYTNVLCRAIESFIVQNDVQFSAHLTEFRDHKVILSKTNDSDLECLYIPLPTAELRLALGEKDSLM